MDISNYSSMVVGSYHINDYSESYGFLSLVLPVKANRWTNIIVGILYIVVTLGMTIGESYAFYIFGSIVEALLLLLIVVYAWKWPTRERVEVTS